MDVLFYFVYWIILNNPVAREVQEVWIWVRPAWQRICECPLPAGPNAGFVGET
jgi:hypothetical protein